MNKKLIKDIFREQTVNYINNQDAAEIKDRHYYVRVRNDNNHQNQQYIYIRLYDYPIDDPKDLDKQLYPYLGKVSFKKEDVEFGTIFTQHINKLEESDADIARHIADVINEDFSGFN